MKILTEPFGTTPNGKDIHLYTLTHAGLTLSVTDLGGCLVRLMTPDRDGVTDDIVLGFDDGEKYLDNPDFFGGIVGPSANRIALGEVVIDGETFHLPVNEGANNLHTDADRGFHKQLWETKVTAQDVVFSLHVPDGMYGLPGDRRVSVSYTITEGAGIRITYHAESDRRTLFNLTNHAYFNLAGHGCKEDGTALQQMPSVLNHLLQTDCAAYTPVDHAMIPTGEITPCVGSAFDFATEKAIGADIGAKEEQLTLTGGYDHNYVADHWTDDHSLRRVAVVREPLHGRVMETWTTLPGVQFYAGNSIHPQTGKYGVRYDRRCAFCLETQYFPDSIHHPQFAQPVFGAGTSFDAVTEYRFS